MMTSAFRTAAIVLATIIPAVGDAADASLTCVTKKIKAVVKKTSDQLQCYQKALLKGIPVDPACLDRADARFAAAIQKADLVGACTGTAGELEASVDGCVATYVSAIATAATTTTIVPTTTTLPSGLGCCGFLVEQQCRWISQSACEQAGGIPGGVGFLCDSASGGCLPAAPSAGKCCTVLDTGSGRRSCFAGPGVSPNQCSAGFPQRVGTLSTGTCPPPGSDGQSACVP
jgi:hypothetical protein